jgi:TPR repeat protein
MGMLEKRTIILNTLLTMVLVITIFQFIRSEYLTSEIGSIDLSMKRAQQEVAQLKEAASASFEQTMRRFDDFGRQLSGIAQSSKNASSRTVAAVPNPTTNSRIPQITSGVSHHSAQTRQASYDERKDQEAKLRSDQAQFLRMRARMCSFGSTGKPAEARTKRCIERMQQLAEEGNSAAQKWMGIVARDRQHDFPMAISWFQQAANHGDTEAMDNLGSIFARGDAQTNQTVPDALVDPMKALYWYGKSASLGDANAMGAIASIYQEGRLTGQSESEAIVWYEMAAKADPSLNKVHVASANFAALLGDIYYKGTSVEQDKLQAYQWYAIACADAARLNRPGDSSCASRGKVASELSPLEVAKAQALAVEWERLRRYPVFGSR